MRIVVIVAGLLFFGGVMGIVTAINLFRPATAQPVIGFLHAECTQYKVCEPEPHVYYITADGSSTFAAAQNPYFEYALEWQPGGSNFVFSADLGNHQDQRHLYLADFSGQHIRRITWDSCHQDYPVWSPDGEWIAFVQSCGLNRLLMKVRPDGSRSTTLAYDYDIVGAPIWTADSSGLIAPVANRSRSIELYRFDSERVQPERLFISSDNITRPVLSPDGQSLLVQRWRDFDQWIYRVPLDGGPVLLMSDPSNYALAPQWSPDGAKVYFINRDRGDALVELAVSTLETRILAFDTWEARPDASGRYVLFLYQFSALGIADLNENSVWQLPTPRGNVYEAEWVEMPASRHRPALLWLLGGVGLVGLVGVLGYRYGVSA